MNTSPTLSKKILLLTGVTLSLLLIPLIAMQFTEEVVWSLSDFVLAGILLFGTGLSYLIITMKAGSNTYKIATGLGLGSGLFLIWANLAVGLIGSENNPENQMYFSVIVVGIIGAVLSRLKARGMMITLFSMAASMIVISIIAFSMGAHLYPHSSVMEIIGVTCFFVVPFVLSGLLFRNAADLEIETGTTEAKNG
ncbi:MAG: hypothetical protein JJ971_04350 [Balneolaceae bacterium]|nr:hypothetical protein [Balneolaceae bacterium]MBO6545605.1 hypothetical protein [Balneolaceae bacterium]MBO6647001.1 hypothetical protein [Balneolaceae bacterium]